MFDLLHHYIDSAFFFDANLGRSITSSIDCLEIINIAIDCLHGGEADIYDRTCCRPLHTCICSKSQKSYFTSEFDKVAPWKWHENNSIGCVDINFTYSSESFLIATFIYRVFPN